MENKNIQIQESLRRIESLLRLLYFQKEYEYKDGPDGFGLIEKILLFEKKPTVPFTPIQKYEKFFEQLRQDIELVFDLPDWAKKQ
jgi:hypothetical protein